MSNDYLREPRMYHTGTSKYPDIWIFADRQSEVDYYDAQPQRYTPSTYDAWLQWHAEMKQKREAARE